MPRLALLLALLAVAGTAQPAVPLAIDYAIDGPASYDPAGDADPVGAGDSVSAAVLVGKALRLPDQKVATLANRVGAYVAARPGATPDLPDEIIKLFHS